MKQTRSTSQKRLIMSIMEDNYNHPTADEIYEQARRTDPHISRGTIYRNLNILSDSGAIRKLAMPEGPDHFDCNMNDHYHFLCRCCNRVFDTEIEYKKELNCSPPGLQGFKTEWHRLVMVGLCSECL
ncbi:MAG: transcriptional repressor [Oscillospiraceae bacterium]